MKKSKFLKNSKDLLSRGFNPSKCKTALKLVGARVKLLRNKKEVQLRQIKREIAQLLESGQDQTAKIRVEHVVREEKMMAAYELIEIYCELIVARMQIIETQKVCPIDLKEAIASVIFASPRCGDVPELGDVKKHFTEKYGKDFVTAAVELRPQSGVSRLLVEKLSTAAPDVQTKIKILSVIAEEHNVVWDSKSFEEQESAPPSDLLMGPRTFGETKIHVEPPPTENLDAQSSQSNHRMHHWQSNLSQQEHRSSLGTVNHSSQNSGVNPAFHHEARPPGDEGDQLFHGERNSTRPDQQRWNIEFKDATSAAQAAAESAELASMAARAAAELSSRDKFKRQYSTESHKSDIHASEHGGPETYVNTNLAREQFFEEPRNRSLSENTGLPNEQIHGMQPNNSKTGGRFNENSHGGMGFSQSTSIKAKASIHDDSLGHNIPDVYSYSEKNSLQEVPRGEIDMQRSSFKYVNARPGKHDNAREDRIGKQPGVPESHSPSIISDDVNVFANYEEPKFRYVPGNNPFLSSGKEGIYRETFQTSSHESAEVVFDRSDSESNIHDYNKGHKYDEHQPGFCFSSSAQNSREHFSVNPDSWSPKSRSDTGKSASPSFPTMKNSDFSEDMKPVDGSKADDPVRVTYDESDESLSESDVKINMPSHSRREDSRNLPHDMSSNSQMDSSYVGESSPDDGMGLPFGKLTGGLRHKRHNPPFLKSQFDTPSSLSKGATATATRPTAPASSESPRTSKMYERKKSEVAPDSRSVSDSDSSDEEESLRKRSDQKSKQYPGAGNEVKVKPSLAASNSYFGSFNSDLDDEPPKGSLSRISHRQNGISQRTKAPSFSSGKISYSKMQFGSETLGFDDGMDGKPDSSSETPKRFEPLRNSSKLEISEQPTTSKFASKPVKSNYWGPPEPYGSGNATSSIKHDSDGNIDRESTNLYTPETRQRYQSLRKNSSKLGNSQQPASTKAASKPTNSNFWGTPNQHHSGTETSATTQEAKKTWHSSARDEPSDTRPKTEASVSSENVKAAATLNKTSSENKRASHVHPKLPDYDTLVQSLRKNRS